MARFTKKTREIMNFIEEYGFITIAICSRVFYKNNRNSYTQAQVKLRTLYNDGELQRYVHTITKEYIYQIKQKEVSDHRKYIMEFYSRMYEYSDEIIYFKLEETIGNRRCDAHMIYVKDEINTGILIEFDKFHRTPKSKLDEIYESGSIQQWYKDNYGECYFPSFVVITAMGVKKMKSDNYEIIGLDYNFSKLEELL